jgi:hypothetical protein
MPDDNGDPLNPASAAYDPEYPDGASLIADERERQIREKGYTAEHDDLSEGELLACAKLIAQDVLADQNSAGARRTWPDHRAGHVRRKYGDDHIRRLTIAGALIAAEIDRLIRAKVAEDSRGQP